MKLFRTVSSDVINECRCFFGITDTKLLIVKRKMKFLCKYCSSENGLCMQTVRRRCQSGTKNVGYILSGNIYIST